MAEAAPVAAPAAEYFSTGDTSLPSLPSTTQPISTPHTINIGTRKSKLARVQTDIVISQLKEKWPHHNYTVHAISTMGDKNQVTALHNFGAKSLWTFELEHMLINKDIDFIVHSLKDIPTQLPPTCTVGAILPRGDPRDAIVFSPTLTSRSPPPRLSTLPPGSVIGTSSVRRSAQLLRLYPHLKFQSVRGNVGTRLSKLDDPAGPFSAIILAAAGLIRIDLGHRISGFLESSNVEGLVAEEVQALQAQQAEAADPHDVGGNPPPAMVLESAEEEAHDAEARQGRLGDRRWGMLHAVGQGALGIEAREGDERVAQLLAPIVCRQTTLACLAERSLMRTLEGGCSVPIGVETEWDADEKDLTMRAIVVSLDGSQAAEAQLVKSGLTMDEQAYDFGEEVAAALVQKGAGEILKAINLDRDVLEQQADNA